MEGLGTVARRSRRTPLPTRVGVMFVLSLVAPEFLFGALGMRGSTGWITAMLPMRGIMPVVLPGHLALTGFSPDFCG